MVERISRRGQFVAYSSSGPGWGTVYRGSVAHTYRLASKSPASIIQVKVDGTIVGIVRKNAEQTVDVCGKLIQVKAIEDYLGLGYYWKLD